MRYDAGYHSAINISTAATRMGTCMVLSSYSTKSIEDVSQASGDGLRWFQLYIFKDKQLTIDLIMRAERAGYKALVVTVDTPKVGKWLVDCHDPVCLPPQCSFCNLTNSSIAETFVPGNYSKTDKNIESVLDASLTWETIDWLREVTKLPILLKGILTAEDAEEALKHNIQGIIVSNHGGRQLDGVQASVSKNEWYTLFYLQFCLFLSFSLPPSLPHSLSPSLPPPPPPLFLYLSLFLSLSHFLYLSFSLLPFLNLRLMPSVK